ncbi:MAG: EFR1 family ferrodoxin [Clostridia bacterium]|nr:EFR1 family ferrodoxin [Clostridia bacterium]
MKKTVYYFSATGNSLTTARMIAEELGECELIPVASLRGNVKTIVEADMVGFVYPVYYGNMPWPVREAVSKMVFRDDAYVFSFATFRGHAGAAAQRLDQLLRTRGVQLALARGVKMPGNSFINPPEVDAEYLAKQRENVLRQMGDIKARVVEDNAATELLKNNPINFANNFRGIVADENCVGCGTCVKVCPMGNIRIVDGHAEIGDDCSTCLACFHWCPKEAIWMSKQEGIERRSKYRHPDVTLEDIAAQKG